MNGWTDVHDCCDRCLDATIEGAVNFRDLGGHPAGRRRVRRGLLYRSAMTHTITQSGLARLAGEYGLRTVIDLRSEEEIAEYGTPPFVDAGVGYLHAPVVARGRAAPPEIVERYRREMREGSFDWSASYLRMIENGGDAFRRVFETLATPGALPAVFHCIAGRDRTGVAAALVLGSLGVSAEDIAADYALTGAHLRRHSRHFSRQAERLGLTSERMAAILETEAEAMHRFLDEVTRRHGSVDGAVAAVGVHAATIETLRTALLEPTG
jgi:protein-tyrosine phosphatase